MSDVHRPAVTTWTSVLVASDALSQRDVELAVGHTLRTMIEVRDGD
ncbi:hypothetical protein ACFQHN_16880 [Natrialbaceae archaeon GCM10025896]